MSDSQAIDNMRQKNANTTLSEAQGVALRITSGVRVSDENSLEQSSTHKPVIVEVSRDLRRILGLVYHDLYLGGKAWIPFELEGEAFKPEGRVCYQVRQSSMMYTSMDALHSTSYHSAIEALNSKPDSYMCCMHLMIILLNRELVEPLMDYHSRVVPRISSMKVRYLHFCFSNMSTKRIIRTQTCILTKEELSDFLATYDIPSEYKVMLPKSNQTIYDAPDRFIGLYTHCFSLANLKLPLPKFFYDVLHYYHIHLSRLNPFGCAILTTFAVMCKAYGGEPIVELFRCFFNLYPGGQWLTFSKRSEKHIPNLLPKWLGRYPNNVRTFLDPILFLAGLKPLWEHDDKDLSFLPHEPSPGFGAGSPSVLINNEPPLVEAEPLDIANPEQLVENTIDSKGLHPAGSSSRATRQKNSPSKVDSPFFAISDDEEGLLDIKGECEVLKEREKAIDKECEELKAKCEVAMADFNNNPFVNAGYQENLVTLESKVGFLEAEKAKLEVTETSLRQEIETVKCDRVEVVLKVVPYVAMDLVQSDEMGRLVAKLVSSAVFYGRCAAFEEVADMKEPFDLDKVKDYRPSYKKEHTRARNDLSTTTFPFLSKVIADPFAPIEDLLSKKPRSLRRPTSPKTHTPAPSIPFQLLCLSRCLFPQPLEVASLFGALAIVEYAWHCVQPWIVSAASLYIDGQ
ncbi:hypothetical protein Tco_0428467 [Tanacetum coccineum]